MKAGITAPPFVTWRTTIDIAGLSWSRFGPTVPVAPAAASVWRPAHWLLKIDAPFVPRLYGDAEEPPDPTTEATYAATSIASWPLTRFAGIGVCGVNFLFVV